MEENFESVHKSPCMFEFNTFDNKAHPHINIVFVNRSRYEYCPCKVQSCVGKHNRSVTLLVEFAF